MTRYSNLGIKRKYVEATAQYREDGGPEAGPSTAGPSSAAAEPEPSPANETPVAGGDAPAPPAKKKRKRGKSRKPKDGDAGAEGAEAAGKDGEEGGAGGEAGTTGGADAGVGKKPTNTKADKGKKKLKAKRAADARKAASEQRRLKRIQERHAQTTCFACRETGHAARDCPKALEGGDENGARAPLGRSVVGICYRCGSKRHSLARCKAAVDPANPLPFASCFVCSGRGHLAGACPQNAGRGVYPNGGCCKLCGETTHLAKHCGMRKQEVGATSVFVGTGTEAGADEDDFHTFKRKTAEVAREEKSDERRKKSAALKVGAFSGEVKAFGRPVQKPKKVVTF
ncbi:hypothetical protein PsYK624_089530 [Phanerochaete sordida]|uniref:CCHC-type domain-containing protein n=1 Tax=Phanerochaete sordida TaxID=48140 RepID=A0A9P3GDA4_9APHY|nr:hypothetical protein PsYK624_089530 [Phanerochaete sordida]